MSENSDDELEQLREERLEELQDQAGDEGGEEAAAQREAAQQQAEAQKKALLRQHLSDDARKRLNTVKMSKPDFGEKVEQQVVALAQSGRIQGKIDDEKMRQILNELKPEEKSFDIRRR